MKREGRQHGMVRTFLIIPSPLNPRPETRVVNKFESPPTCGIFTKVSQKPTNRSKFTGKCCRPRCTACHTHPASKSKDKAKGTRKLTNSRDLASYYKMIMWRVVDLKPRPGFNFSGFSATGILDHLSDSDVDYDALMAKFQSPEGMDHIWEIVNADDDDALEQDIMNFYDVGNEFDQVEGDEGWCLVGM